MLTSELYLADDVKKIFYEPGAFASVALVRAGLIPTAPLVPTLAFDIQLIRLYRSMNKFHRRLGLQPFIRGIYDFQDRTHLTASAYQLSKAYDCFLLIQRSITKLCNDALGRNDEDFRLKRSCSACTYKLTGEPTLPYSLLLAADGNMSLRRFEKVGTADKSSFDSSYFVSREYVSTWADVVQARKPQKEPQNKEDEDLQDAQLQDGVAPNSDLLGADGGLLPRAADPLSEAFDGIVSDCAEKWKANADDDKKVMWDCFEECGIFITICRHGILLLSCDIVKSGELYVYFFLLHYF